MKNQAFLSVLFLVLLCLAICHAESAVVPATIAVGDVVSLGNYEQDGDNDNGQEPIEWVVLDVQGDKALLLSRHILDAKPYNVDEVDITWEQCTLRAWLNSEFLDAAFSEEEQSVILITDVDNSLAQGQYGTFGGNDTQDKIFLLSYYEAHDMYFTDDESRKCGATWYASSRGAATRNNIIVDDLYACPWWLRTPWLYQIDVSAVNFGGTMAGGYCTDSGLGVRPAIWINLNADVF